MPTFLGNEIAAAEGVDRSAERSEQAGVFVDARSPMITLLPPREAVH